MSGYRDLADRLALERTPLADRPVPPPTLALLEHGAARNPQAPGQYPVRSQRSEQDTSLPA